MHGTTYIKNPPDSSKNSGCCVQFRYKHIENVRDIPRVVQWIQDCDGTPWLWRCAYRMHILGNVSPCRGHVIWC